MDSFYDFFHVIVLKIITNFSGRWTNRFDISVNRQHKDVLNQGFVQIWSKQTCSFFEILIQCHLELLHLKSNLLFSFNQSDGNPKQIRQHQQKEQKL